MKVIDARSGTEMHVGDTVDWGDGESITLLEVKPGWLSASAHVRRVGARDMLFNGAWQPVTNTFWTPLQVRWTHPRFFLRHVAFLPS